MRYPIRNVDNGAHAAHVGVFTELYGEVSGVANSDTISHRVDKARLRQKSHRRQRANTKGVGIGLDGNIRVVVDALWNHNFNVDDRQNCGATSRNASSP